MTVTDEQPGCIFCDGFDTIVVDATPHMLTRLDNYPANPGHVEIIPKRHVESLFDLDGWELMELWQLLMRARARMEVEYGPHGYTIGVNEGRAAGRSIDHVHVHLIPRHEGDVPNPAGGIRRIFPDCDPGVWAVAQ